MAPNMEQIARLCFPAARRVTDRYKKKEKKEKRKKREEEEEEKKGRGKEGKTGKRKRKMPEQKNSTKKGGPCRRNSLMRAVHGICALSTLGRLFRTKESATSGSTMPQCVNCEKASDPAMRPSKAENRMITARKQLLSRTEHSYLLLYKKESLWRNHKPCARTRRHPVRAGIRYTSDIKKAYYLSMRLGTDIPSQCRYKDAALTRLARWYDEVEKSGFLAFGRVARSVQMHYREIINFFDRRSTNAASESFNAKIKEFRTQFRGVKDRAFFLFRNPSDCYVNP